jgi:hypothetical protein
MVSLSLRELTPATVFTYRRAHPDESPMGMPVSRCCGGLAALILGFAVAAASVAAEQGLSLSAGVLTIDCGPRDGAFGPSGGGAQEAAWVPLDGSDRSTDWSGNAPQTLLYEFTPALPAGLYRLRCYFTIQPGCGLSLSLLANGQKLSGPALIPGPPAGTSVYPLHSVEARYRYAGGPLKLVLLADRIPAGDRIRAIRLELTSFDKLTADGNVAREATVAVDSETGGYPASALNDSTTEYGGSTPGRSCCSAETPQDHWATFELPQPETIGHVIVYWACYPRGPDLYNTARELEIQYQQDGQWVPVLRLPTPFGVYRTVYACKPFTASAVRLFMPAGKGPANRPNLLWMNEVELYRAGTWPGRQPSATGRTELLLAGSDGEKLVTGVGVATVPVVQSVVTGGLDQGTPGDTAALLLGGDGNPEKAPAGAQVLLHAGDKPIANVRVTVAALSARSSGQSLAVL